MQLGKVLVASDSFKGCLSSRQVADAVGRGVKEMFPEAVVESVLIADGGEGTMRTLVEALKGELVQVPANDTAVLDMAETGGITRLKREELSPLTATTYGLGEQIRDALEHGCKTVLIGLGGSATTDGGKGMVEALEGVDVKNTKFRILCDVNNPLYGENGAAYIFAPQKGASPEQVRVLDQRLRDWAAASPHPEMADVPGAGAAGGLGFACMCWLGGELVSGIETVLEYQHFDEKVQGAEFVFTGEGKMDKQTLMNKAPYGVLQHAMRGGARTFAMAGKVEDYDRLVGIGFIDVCCINPPDTPLEVAMQPEFAMERVTETTKRILYNIYHTILYL